MRVVQKTDGKGSLRWMQEFVNDRQAELDPVIAKAVGLSPDDTISWRSPRRDDEFAEYRDQDFLDRLNISTGKRSLRDFWPRLGPQWDGLATTSSNQVILVEAKGHDAEVESPGSGASPDSLALIERSLAEAKAYYGVKPDVSWSGKYYQYANRLAHLYFLREVNEEQAHLVFLYFYGDAGMPGPATLQSLRTAVDAAHKALGLAAFEHPFVHEAFVDVSAPRATV
jgi:hypothetical protein